MTELTPEQQQKLDAITARLEEAFGAEEVRRPWATHLREDGSVVLQEGTTIVMLHGDDLVVVDGSDPHRPQVTTVHADGTREHNSAVVVDPPAEEPPEVA